MMCGSCAGSSLTWRDPLASVSPGEVAFHFPFTPTHARLRVGSRLLSAHADPEVLLQVRPLCSAAGGPDLCELPLLTCSLPEWRQECSLCFCQCLWLLLHPILVALESPYVMSGSGLPAPFCVHGLASVLRLDGTGFRAPAPIGSSAVHLRTLAAAAAFWIVVSLSPAERCSDLVNVCMIVGSSSIELIPLFRIATFVYWMFCSETCPHELFGLLFCCFCDCG